MNLLERFLKYVSFETTSDEIKEDTCSNPLELKLAQEMMDELKELNPDEIFMNQFGVVDAKFHGDPKETPIAFLAHMDTSNQASGKNVKARLVKYDGGDIELQPGMNLSPKDFESLNHSIGHELIVTDGNTLLGGDDKAGIAIIMTALTDILKNNVHHRPLEIIFTTDEEIGVDAEHISIDKVTAKYGYTVDGGDYRYLSIESFTAYAMHVHVDGKSIHPGSAKDKLINAATTLFKFHEALPEYLRPEHTSEKEPFFHLCEITGCEDHADADYIIRSFDETQIESMIKLAQFTAKRMNELLGYEAVKLEVRNQYHNMKTVLDRYPEIQKEIESVYEKLGMEYHYEAIRGGTTGSTLSFMGLPCPNIGTGDYNMHGRYEYVDYDEMKQMVKVVTELMR